MSLTLSQKQESQRMLNALGFDAGVVDGILGTRTKAATLKFQQAHSVYPQDGILGPITFNKLKSVYDGKVINTTTAPKAQPVPSSINNASKPITDALRPSGMNMNKIGMIAGVLAIAGYAYYEFIVKGKKGRK